MPQWDRVHDFHELEDEFFERAHRMIWCSVATVDRNQRPTSRLLHAIWEHSSADDAVPVGWIATRRTSPKARDLAANPHVSLAYIADLAKPLYADCLAEWADDPSAKGHLWNLFATSAPPLGYDPAPIFGSVESADFGALRLTPWRIQLGMPNGERRTWLREGR